MQNVTINNDGNSEMHCVGMNGGYFVWEYECTDEHGAVNTVENYQYNSVA